MYEGSTRLSDNPKPYIILDPKTSTPHPITLSSLQHLAPCELLAQGFQELKGGLSGGPGQSVHLNRVRGFWLDRVFFVELLLGFRVGLGYRALGHVALCLTCTAGLLLTRHDSLNLPVAFLALNPASPQYPSMVEHSGEYTKLSAWCKVRGYFRSPNSH